MERSVTPLPDIDQAAVDAFWQRAREALELAPTTPRPASVGPFGDSSELADELLGYVLDGPKRATASALAGFVHDGEPVPAPGDLWVVTDGSGRPRALLRTTDVRIGPLSSVDDQFAWDEGEGDRTRATWLDDHTRYFARYLPSIGRTFDPEMATVFERFELLYGE